MEQDHRDLRAERRRLGVEKAYSFMIRVGLPGGWGTAKQYIAMDDISNTGEWSTEAND
jgi:sulfite reductase (NADPH) hemoprotein beta-component